MLQYISLATLSDKLDVSRQTIINLLKGNKLKDETLEKIRTRAGEIIDELQEANIVAGKK
jgi:transcriptional antiterminator